nr:L27 domain containing protein [Haemonchus contortus]
MATSSWDPSLVVAHIRSLLEPTAGALELQLLLQSSVVEACLQAHDVVIAEIYDSEGRGSFQSPVSDKLQALHNSFFNDGVLPMETKKPGHSAGEIFPDSSEVCDDSDDPLLDSVARVRLVHFQKDSDEPMGITLKVDAKIMITIHPYPYDPVRSGFHLAT